MPKRVIIFILVFCLLFSNLTVTAAHKNDPEENNSFHFDLNGVTGYDKILHKEIKNAADAKHPSGVASTIYVVTVNDIDARIYNDSNTPVNVYHYSRANKAKRHPVFMDNDGRPNYLRPFPQDDKSTLLQAGFSEEDLDPAAKGYYYFYFDFTVRNAGGKIYGVLVQVIQTKTVDKSELEAALSTAPNAEDYYTEGDTYNGSTVDKNGFWNTLQEIVVPAKAVLDDPEATQKAVNDAVDALRTDTPDAPYAKALAGIIPKTNINPTFLYETLLKTDTVQDEDYYTPISWKPYYEKLSAAQAIMEKIYQDGVPTEFNRGPNATGPEPEGAIHQADADAAAEALIAVQPTLMSKSAQVGMTKTNNHTALLLKHLIPLVETAKAENYTADSWAAFQDALARAKSASKPELTGTIADDAAYKAYQKVYTDLYQAYYYDLTTKEPFTIEFIAFDANGARAGNTANGISETVELAAGDKLDTLLSKYNFTLDPYGFTAVFRNGVLVSGNYLDVTWEYSPDPGNISLHPGDRITYYIGKFFPRMTTTPTIGSMQARMWMYVDSLHETRFQEEQGFVAEAGKPFTLNATETAAYLAAPVKDTTAATNRTIFVSEPQDAPSGMVATKKFLVDGTPVVTDAQGQAAISLYQEGWHLIQAYDLQEDEMGDDPNWGGVDKAGNYHCTNSAATIWVQVKPSSDPDKVKAKLKETLDQTYHAYPETYFSTEDWNQIQTAYDTAVKAMEEAQSVGDAYTAQQTAMAEIKRIHRKATEENAKNLEEFRKQLNLLPDDVSLITESVRSTVEALTTAYNAMTVYQREQLTGVEKEKYQAIADKLQQGLGEAVSYSLTLNIQGDTQEATAALNDMVSYLREHTAHMDDNGGGYGGGELEKSFVFQSYDNGRTGIVESATPLTTIRLPMDIDYAAYYHVRDAAEHTISGTGWSISDPAEGGLRFTEMMFLNYGVDGDLAVELNGVPYEIKSITYNGIESYDVHRDFYTTLDFGTYKGKDKDWCNLRFNDAYMTFLMPYEDVTITVNWGPVDRDGKLEAAKLSAKATLTTEFETYQQDNYTPENWTALNTAYQDALTAIDKAATEDEVVQLRKNAIAAMAAIPVLDTSTGDATLPDYGKVVGRVYISMENNTYPDAPEPFKGAFVSGWYNLCEQDTMMTALLKALKQEGFGWVGTGGTTASGYDITYLATVFQDTDGDGILDEGESKLSQFDNGGGSGWMGTLNDWFTNEGFNAFTVESNMLESGDSICAVYTKDTGEDVGGSWNNSDTSLKNLVISGGTLTPEFDGENLKYVLAIEGDRANVQVTPTAANKNYQTRIFLNTYNEDAAAYKRTEMISVTSGDVLYVGCGENGWPTMNETSNGTRYTIRVATASSTESVISLIDEIGKVTYNNYKKKQPQAEAARSAYEALTAEMQQQVTNLSKLTEAEEQIRKFAAIDLVKTQLGALPEELTIAHKDAVNELRTNYEALTEEQKNYFSIADNNRLKTVFDQMDRLLAAEVQKLIDAIDEEVTLDSEPAITAAREAYTALTEAQKKLVNTDKLIAAEAALKELQSSQAAVDAVIQKIDSIGTVTLSSGDLIKEARDAFNKLSEEQQKLVTNLDKLIAAEQALFDLQIEDAYEKTAEKLLNSSTTTGSTKGEWKMLGLARAGKTIPDAMMQEYEEALLQYLEKNYDSSTGKLHPFMATENQRIALALTALGYNATSYHDYDLLKALSDTAWVNKQGNNSTCFALLALNARDEYGDANLRAELRDTLLNNQMESGAWSIDPAESKENQDVTAMIIQALAPDYSDSRVKAAVDKALDWLSQNASMNTAEGCAQILCAYAALGREADETLLRELMKFALPDGGFKHLTSGNYNQMATEQCFYALAAYYRQQNHQNSLYDMRDVTMICTQYHITVEQPANGRIEVSKTTAGEQEEITVTVLPDTGYELETLTIDGTSVAVDSSNQAVFTMPAHDVTITASFKETENILSEIAELMKSLHVADAKKETYDKLQRAVTAYEGLEPSQQAQLREQYPEAYQNYLDALELYEQKLNAVRKDILADLDSQFNNLNQADYTKENWEKIEALYKDAKDAVNQGKYAEALEDALNHFKTQLEKIEPGSGIEVTFRLIGDSQHDNGTEDHQEYITWVETTTYTMAPGATVYDLFVEAMGDAGLDYKGADTNYVSTIQAPAVFGGYWLGEFDNGRNSGWMYTVNGEHPSMGLQDWTLEDQDVVIWHYVDDYTTEENQGTWLEAADISPEDYAEQKLGEILNIGLNGNAEPSEITLQDLGKDITFKFQPDEGYEVKSVVIDGEDMGNLTEYTYKNLNIFSRIEVEFCEAAVMDFVDVDVDDWFYEDVRYTVSAGLFRGTSSTTFSPKNPMSRAMLVTVLYRLEGEPEVNGTSSFTDVKSGTWYSDAVQWAEENHIVNGVGNHLFAPKKSITREQIATILYRYANYKEYDTSNSSDLAGFSDYHRISNYALEAVQWANAEGLMIGRTTTILAPKGTATRAEAAAILHRFMEHVVK